MWRYTADLLKIIPLSIQVRLLRQLFQSEPQCEPETRPTTKWQLQELRSPIPVRHAESWQPSTWRHVWLRPPLPSLSFLPGATRCHFVLFSGFFSPAYLISFMPEKYFASPSLRLLQVVPLLQSQFFQAQESQSQQPLQLSLQVGWKGTKPNCGHGASHRSSYCSHLRAQTKAPCPSFISWHDDLWGNESERPCINKPRHSLKRQQIFWMGNCGTCKAQRYVYIWYRSKRSVSMTHL